MLVWLKSTGPWGMYWSQLRAQQICSIYTPDRSALSASDLNVSVKNECPNGQSYWITSIITNKWEESLFCLVRQLLEYDHDIQKKKSEGALLIFWANMQTLRINQQNKL